MRNSRRERSAASKKAGSRGRRRPAASTSRRRTPRCPSRCSASSRRLAATDAPTASSETEYYSLEEIRNYQICLWTAIALISVLLSAVLFLACMRPEYDSLLYATFQANVGDHFGKEN